MIGLSTDGAIEGQTIVVAFYLFFCGKVCPRRCLFVHPSGKARLSWTIMIWFQIAVVLFTRGIISQLDSPQCCTPNLKRPVQCPIA